MPQPRPYSCEVEPLTPVEPVSEAIRLMGSDDASFGERVQQVAQSHLEQMMSVFAAELNVYNSAWEARTRELREENDRLRDRRELRPDDSPAPSPRTPPSACVASVRSGDKKFPEAYATLSAPPVVFVAEETDDACTTPSPRVPKKRMNRLASSKSGFFKVSENFEQLDVEGSGVVKISEITQQLAHVDDGCDSLHLENLGNMLDSLRKAKPELFQGLADDEVSYPIFREVMLGKDWEFLHEHKDTVMALRSSVAKDSAAAVVSNVTSVEKSHLTRKLADVPKERLWWLEPAVGFVIILNAISIGVSQDFAKTSDFWKVCEILFTAFFVGEFALKLWDKGFLHHFLGADWRWNLFDFLIVVSALVDIIFLIYVNATDAKKGMSDTLGDLTVLRILRLLRITRLVRLFRLKMLKELTLMANGIVGGLRTLFWAFVLLFGLIYAMAIFLHQLMSDWKQNIVCDEQDSQCNFFEQTLYDNYHAMFADLFKTIFTVFRCVTGDCNFPTGVPVAPVLLETQGRILVVGYVCSFLFVVFGVFNLIMAVFVENTMETAKQDQQKREQLRHQEQMRVAHKLQQLVNKIVSSSQRKPRKDSPDGLLRYLPRMGSNTSNSSSTTAGDEVSIDYPISLKVSKEIFHDAWGDQESQKLLEDLEISLSNRQKLFDILDSDGNGFLDIHEIVDGVMRLRGPADKGDIVSTSLMIRSLQKSFSEIQSAIKDLQYANHQGGTP